MPDTYHVFCGDRRQFWAAEQLRARGCVVLTHGVPGAEDWPLPAALAGKLLLPFPSFQGEYLRGKNGLPIAAPCSARTAQTLRRQAPPFPTSTAASP